MNRTKLLAILVFSVLFCLSLKNSLTVTMNGSTATAVCVSEPPKTNRRARRWFSGRESRFRYADENGQTHTASIWISLAKPKVGDEVKIRYAKDSPELIYYDSPAFVWMLPAITGGLLLFPLAKLFVGRTKSDS